MNSKLSMYVVVRDEFARANRTFRLERIYLFTIDPDYCMWFSLFFIVYYSIYIVLACVQSVYLHDLFYAWIIMLLIKVLATVGIIIWHRDAIEKYVEDSVRNLFVTNKFIVYVTLEMTESICLLLLLTYMTVMEIKGEDAVNHFTIFGILPLLNIVFKTDYLMTRIVRSIYK